MRGAVFLGIFFLGIIFYVIYAAYPPGLHEKVAWGTLQGKCLEVEWQRLIQKGNIELIEEVELRQKVGNKWNSILTVIPTEPLGWEVEQESYDNLPNIILNPNGTVNEELKLANFMNAQDVEAVKEAMLESMPNMVPAPTASPPQQPQQQLEYISSPPPQQNLPISITHLQEPILDAKDDFLGNYQVGPGQHGQPGRTFLPITELGTLDLSLPKKDLQSFKPDPAVQEQYVDPSALVSENTVLRALAAKAETGFLPNKVEYASKSVPPKVAKLNPKVRRQKPKDENANSPYIARKTNSLGALRNALHGSPGLKDARENAVQICPICKFQATTKNPYRHLQDHLARCHFKERIAADLPTRKPYICPMPGCDQKSYPDWQANTELGMEVDHAAIDVDRVGCGDSTAIKMSGKALSQIEDPTFLCVLHPTTPKNRSLDIRSSEHGLKLNEISPIRQEEPLKLGWPDPRSDHMDMPSLVNQDQDNHSHVDSLIPLNTDLLHGPGAAGPTKLWSLIEPTMNIITSVYVGRKTTKYVGSGILILTVFSNLVPAVGATCPSNDSYELIRNNHPMINETLTIDDANCKQVIVDISVEPLSEDSENSTVIFIAEYSGKHLSYNFPVQNERWSRQLTFCFEGQDPKAPKTVTFNATTDSTKQLKVKIKIRCGMLECNTDTRTDMQDTKAQDDIEHYNMHVICAILAVLLVLACFAILGCWAFPGRVKFPFGTREVIVVPPRYPDAQVPLV